MTVQATIIHYPGGRTETKVLASADEFRRLLDGLHKKAKVSFDGKPPRQTKQWRSDRDSWPWPASADTVSTAPIAAPAGSSPAATPAQPSATSPPFRGEGTVASGRASEIGQRESKRVEEISQRVDGLRSDVEALVEQVRPLPLNINEVDKRLANRLSEEAGSLRSEFRKISQEEIRPVASSIAGLADEIRTRPEKSEISALVDQAVAPTEKRLGDALQRLREENEILAEESEEQRRRVRAYRPGTIEQLQQRIEEMRQDLKGRSDELTTAHKRIDSLERDNAHLKESTGAFDREELTKTRQQIAKEREELESVKALEAERDQLREQVADYQKLEARYRATQDLKQRDILLEEQLRDTEKRRDELDADLAHEKGQADKRRRAFKTLQERHDALKQRGDELAEENQSLNGQAQQQAEQLAALETAAAQHDEEKKVLEAERRDLSAWRTKEEQALAARRRELDGETRARIEAQDSQHSDRMALLDDEHARRQETVEEQVRAAVTAGFEHDLRQAQHDRNTANELRDRAIEDSERYRTKLMAMQAEHAEWEGQERERERARLRLEESVSTLSNRKDELLGEIKDLGRQFNEKVDENAARLSSGNAEVQSLKESITSLEGRVEGARNRLADVDKQYQDELGLVRALHEERRRLEEPASREVRVKSMLQPIPDFVAEKRGRAADNLEEMTWLDDLDRRIRESEFVFPRRVLEAFHTSLKITHWSPLTVLAGMSGTGKSALSRLYAHFGGLRFHMVPVQPNWDSPQDLFGFFNHIDGLYKASPLLRAMVQSQRPAHEGGFDDGLLLVGLDEMNLARVEYYGSELLSRWEARRDGVAAEALQLDIGHGEHESVNLGGNVLWVGTMNEDETTLSLSDKVIERGNVITFPRPKALQRREHVGLGPAGPWLRAKTFTGWTVESSTLAEDVRGRIKNALEDINHRLGLVHRSVSHRTLQAIENYVANHPRVRVPAKNGGSETEKWWKRAFADQLVQKVMPKLRGLDNHSGEGKKCLEGFERAMGDYAEELVPDFREARKPPQFLWVSSSYLEADEKNG